MAWWVLWWLGCPFPGLELVWGQAGGRLPSSRAGELAARQGEEWGGKELVPTTTAWCGLLTLSFFGAGSPIWVSFGRPVATVTWMFNTTPLTLLPPKKKAYFPFLPGFSAFAVAVETALQCAALSKCPSKMKVSPPSTLRASTPVAFLPRERASGVKGAEAGEGLYGLPRGHCLLLQENGGQGTEPLRPGGSGCLQQEGGRRGSGRPGGMPRVDVTSSVTLGSVSAPHFSGCPHQACRQGCAAAHDSERPLVPESPHRVQCGGADCREAERRRVPGVWLERDGRVLHRGWGSAVRLLWLG